MGSGLLASRDPGMTSRRRWKSRRRRGKHAAQGAPQEVFDVPPVAHAEIVRARRHAQGDRRRGQGACVCGRARAAGDDAAHRPLALPQALPQPGAPCRRGLHGRPDVVSRTVEPARLPDAVLDEPAVARQPIRCRRCSGGSRAASSASSRRTRSARRKRNVAHHYDLGNAFYRSSSTRACSIPAPISSTTTDTLEEAQRNKLRLIAAKLRLEPGLKVLDIGSGWGDLALYLAAIEDVDVTGVTLSKEQHALSNEKARRAGLADRVRFELLDYRAHRSAASTASSRSACSSTSACSTTRSSSPR